MSLTTIQSSNVCRILKHVLEFSRRTLYKMPEKNAFSQI